MKASDVFSNISTIMLGFGLYDSVYGSWQQGLFSEGAIEASDFGIWRIFNVLILCAFVSGFVALAATIDKKDIKELAPLDLIGSAIAVPLLYFLIYVALGVRTMFVFVIATVFTLLASVARRREA